MPAAAVFTSIAQWRSSKRIPAISVFRGVHPNEIAKLACEVRDVTLVLDEIDRACVDKKWAADRKLVTPDCNEGAWVKRVVHEGRHYRVSLWGSCRRMQSVPEDLLSQADLVNLFRVDPVALYDLRTIEQRFGPDAAKRVQTLERGEFLTFGDLS